MDLIKLFWYKINSNSISMDVTKNTLENHKKTLVSALFSNISQLFWTFLHYRINIIYVH